MYLIYISEVKRREEGHKGGGTHLFVFPTAQFNLGTALIIFI
jgi:hypothetical protein